MRIDSIQRDASGEVMQGVMSAIQEFMAYLAEAGTERGSELHPGLQGREATDGEVETGERVVDRTAASMGRTSEKSI